MKEIKRKYQKALSKRHSRSCNKPCVHARTQICTKHPAEQHTHTLTHTLARIHTCTRKHACMHARTCSTWSCWWKTDPGVRFVSCPGLWSCCHMSRQSNLHEHSLTKLCLSLHMRSSLSKCKCAISMDSGA